MTIKKTPTRAEIPTNDKWDLKSLYKKESEWESDLELITVLSDELLTFKGKLNDGPDTLRNALDTFCRLQMVEETSGSYAFLLTAADGEDATAQDKYGRYMIAASTAEAKTSFFIPEIQEIPEEKLITYTSHPDYIDYKIFIRKLLYMKKFILSDKEEKLLALESVSGTATHKAFSMLTNVDMDFGKIKINGTYSPLTQSTWSSFMQSSDRDIRKKAYTKFYSSFEKNKNTIAALYAGSVDHDIFEARARGYSSARAMALYPDKVPETVYDNLVSTIRNNLAPLHKYYSLRKKILGVDELKHYDVYVPLVPSITKITPYTQAVEIIRNALAPLGKEYTDVLCTGLTDGWVDKYENKGKRSGAFSEGVYIGNPYILMNYKEDLLRDVFTLAHEGGHSMHSWYSVHSNAFMHYNYTIFEAEVASTFNEQLVYEYLFKNAENDNMRKYLLAMRIDDILATLYRQTMFAEFEHTTHTLVENGTPLSADILRSEYRKLLVTYFGPEMKFEKNSDLEGLRIPHFYNAYYVYKYATGISAALALAQRVLNGGNTEREDYFKFLKSGGSRYPIESLRIAGVDMESTTPIQKAVDTFSSLVNKLEELSVF